MVLRIGLYIVAAALFGAHFLRVGNVLAVVLCLSAPLLFCYRRRWILVLLQFLAYTAAGGWLVIMQVIVEQRQVAARPWLAAALILGAAALVSLLAGLLLNSRSFRRRYPR